MTAGLKRAFIIAIDGPAGVGKSTVARLLARQLGITYLDSGALYRAIAWFLMQKGVSGPQQITNEIETQSVVELSSSLQMVSDPEGTPRIYLGAEEITSDIRSHAIDRFVARVAERPRIREGITELQRRLAESRNVVVEGRDAGTVVFPHADAKFYLDATLRARARRRRLQSWNTQHRKSLREHEEDLAARDALDMNRAIAPLRKASDAIEIDTSDLAKEQVVNRILEYLKSKSIVAGEGVKPLTEQAPVLIAVAGLIGVGKSTLCEWLSRALKVQLFSENPDENPFIRDYYEEPKRWALHSQLWFLARKHELLTSVGDERTAAITDRTLHEDYMFAQTLLKGDDLRLYEHYYGMVFASVPQPSVIVSLEASLDVLAKRITRRNRKYEEHLSPLLLSELKTRYDEWIANPDVPVIRVDAESDDAICDAESRDRLLARIREAIGGESI